MSDFIIIILFFVKEYILDHWKYVCFSTKFQRRL